MSEAPFAAPPRPSAEHLLVASVDRRGLRQRRWIAGRHQQAVSAMVDPVPDTANIGRDRGNATRSGLNQHRWSSLLIAVTRHNRRQTEDIGGGHERAESCVIARRKKADPVVEVEVPAKPVQAVFQGPSADDDERSLDRAQ
jgi:hypothetical protein